MRLLNEILLSVIEISLSTGAAILILLLISPFLQKRYAAKWRYYIWIVLAVRLVVPYNINLPVRQIEMRIPVRMTEAAMSPAADAVNAANAMPAMSRPEERAASVTALDAAAVVWLVVFAGIILVHLCGYARLRARIVRRGIYVEDGLISEKLSVLRKELGIKRDIPAIRYRDAASPMIIGFFRPLLVIPDHRYNETELFFILKHELIHLRRHDTFFKFLFMAARAVHWFNPAIALMQRAAAVDMELACDERVIQGISYDRRKAYTETLMSSLDRQYKKTGLLTTQFCGGDRVMKRRFQNILGQSGRRRGFLLLAFVACMTLILGTMTGCAVTQTESSDSAKAQVDEGQTQGEQEISQQEDGFAPSEEQTDDTMSGSEDAAKQDQAPDTSDEVRQQDGQAQTEHAGEQGSDSQPPYSEDALEIMEVANALALAYFDGDQEKIRDCLADSYDGEIDVYTDAGPGLTGMISVKGVGDIKEAEIGDTQTVSVMFNMLDTGEGLRYLTLDLIKQEDGWKVEFYGLEM